MTAAAPPGRVRAQAQHVVQGEPQFPAVPSDADTGREGPQSRRNGLRPALRRRRHRQDLAALPQGKEMTKEFPFDHSPLLVRSPHIDT